MWKEQLQTYKAVLTGVKGQRKNRQKGGKGKNRQKGGKGVRMQGCWTEGKKEGRNVLI